MVLARSVHRALMCECRAYSRSEALRGFPDALAVLQRAGTEDGDDATAKRRVKVVLCKWRAMAR